MRTIITEQDIIAPETLGTKDKFWVKKNDVKWLCKIVRANTGEDWAEVVAQRLAERLNLPVPNHQLAIFEGKNAVLSQNFIPPNCSLALGNTLLTSHLADYPIRQKYKNKLHTLPNVYEVLNKYKANRNYKYKNAFEQFTGYLLLDALIANTDRHHENWGIIRNEILGSAYLADTFDHGSSLGCRVSPDECENRLNSKDRGYNVWGFVRTSTARSALFEDESSTKPLDYIQAFLMCSQLDNGAFVYWKNILKEQVLSETDLFQNLDIDKRSTAFALEIIQENKRRILS